MPRDAAGRAAPGPGLRASGRVSFAAWKPAARRPNIPGMYEHSAGWYDLLYTQGLGKDYEAEAESIHRLIQERAPGSRTLLDVACGTGRHLRFLSRWYEAEGIDLVPAMIEVARAANPGLAIRQGDLVDFELGRRFDAVACLFSSIAYGRTDDRLTRAVANLASHLAPGGLLIVDGWISPEDWRPGEIAVHSATDGRRHLVRMTHAGRRGEVSTLDFHFLAGDETGIRHFSEHHELALFTRDQYRHPFEAAGLSFSMVAGEHGRDRYAGSGDRA